MDGLNKKFLKDPLAFLQRYPLRVRARSDGPMSNTPLKNLNPKAIPPIFDFGLTPITQGVELIPFVFHVPQRFKTQHPISAYWLDYVSEETSRLQGNLNDADYLFTPMLDGCYIAIGDNAIAHVTGDMPKSRTAGTTKQHATTAVGSIRIGFDSTPADATQCTFVGIRGNTRWSWYVQGHDSFTGQYGALQPVFDGGRSVIQLTDTTYG